MKKGQKLKAIDTCTMYESGKDALIIGKIYKVNEVTEKSIKIKSEIDESHSFDLKDIPEFFEVL